MQSADMERLNSHTIIPEQSRHGYYQNASLFFSCVQNAGGDPLLLAIIFESLCVYMCINICIFIVTLLLYFSFVMCMHLVGLALISLFTDLFCVIMTNKTLISLTL